MQHTYDCTELLVPGENVIAVHVGLGWWGHPAVPPQATRFPYGPPTVRMLLRATSDHDADATVTEVGTDATWQQTGGEPPRYRCHLGCILLKMPAISLLTGPVTYDDEYNGQTVDARLETPGCKTHDDCWHLGCILSRVPATIVQTGTEERVMYPMGGSSAW